MKTFEQRKKEEFIKLFDYRKSTGYQGDGAIPAIDPDEVWSFFSQSLSDYKKELGERIKDNFEDVKDPFGFGMTTLMVKTGTKKLVKIKGDKRNYEMQGWNEAKLEDVLSLLQKDKED